MHSRFPHNRTVVASIAAALALAAPAASHASILGFGDFSDFSINVGDTGSAPTITPGQIRLTNQSGDESRSVFDKTPQSVAQFTASFTYQVLNANPNEVSGATFVLQNATNGAAAIGGYGSYLGYAGIGSSAAITLEIVHPNASGFYTNGNLGGGSNPISPVNLLSGDPINVTLSYNGSILHENLTDATTGDTFNASYVANLPGAVGGSTAYVGVTASTSFRSDQYFSNFNYVTSATPEPASLGLGSAGVGLLALRRRRSDSRNTAMHS